MIVTVTICPSIQAHMSGAGIKSGAAEPVIMNKALRNRLRLLASSFSSRAAPSGHATRRAPPARTSPARAPRARYTDVSITTRSRLAHVDADASRWSTDGRPLLLRCDGHFTLVAGAYEETRRRAAFIRTPTGTYPRRLQRGREHAATATSPKKAELKRSRHRHRSGRPTALILRIFRRAGTRPGYGTFTGDNNLIVAGSRPRTRASSRVSGAVATTTSSPRHRRLAGLRDFVCPAQTPEPLARRRAAAASSPNTGLAVGSASLPAQLPPRHAGRQQPRHLQPRRQGDIGPRAPRGQASTPAILRGDGTLGVYGSAPTPLQTPTAGNPGATLAMQDDGNLVIYSKDGRARSGRATPLASEA